MVNNDLAKLRAEVRKRRSAVTAKENRIKRNTGVDLRDTAQDPRRPTKTVDRLNTPQLKSYLKELDSFMSRDNGFVAGANNAPIPKKDWLAYKRVEKKYNEIGKSHFEQIADIFIKPFGMTVAERDKRMVPDSLRSQGEIVHRPYGEIDRKASRIKDAAALDKLKKAMEKKLTKDFLPEQIAAARNQLSQMLNGMTNEESLKEKASKLTDSQFNVLWNYTSFATAISAVSESGGHRSKATKDADSSDRYMTGVKEGYSDDVGKLLDWAEELPEESGTKRSAPSTGKKARTRKKKN